MEAIVFVMVHLVKLARQHHIYTQATIIDARTAQNRYDARQTEHFATDSDPKVFALLHSIITHVLATLGRDESGDGSIAFTLLACLRLLKLNIYAFVCFGGVPLSKAFEKAGWRDGGEELLVNFRTLLLRIIRSAHIDLGTSLCCVFSCFTFDRFVFSLFCFIASSSMLTPSLCSPINA
jgi:hypothetical protein